MLQGLAAKFEIDYRFCKYGSMSDDAFPVQNDTTDLPEMEQHNSQVQAAIDSYLDTRQSFAIIDKGRTKDERSCIWVEKGHFYGMGYIDMDVAINNPSEVKEHVTPYKTNQYIMQLIFSFAQKYPRNVHLQNNDFVDSDM